MTGLPRSVPAPDPHTLVRAHTVYSCVMGSRAFGLDTAASDTDRRGVFVAPSELFWRFDKPPTHVDGPAEEQFSWELERFCTLGLRANPTVLECLHSPLVEYADGTGRELLGLRGAFLSRHAHRTFTGYVDGQHRKIEARVRRGAPPGKPAMHLLRLQLALLDLLRTGTLTLDVGEHRDELLAIRHDETPWAQVEKRLRTLRAASEAAAARTPLPAEPDVRRIEDFLVRVRRTSASAPASAPDSDSGSGSGSGRSPS